jgi:hypothetical protein
MFITAFVMLLILGIQAPPLTIYKKWWDLLVFLAFWTGATVYAVLVVAEVFIPTTTEVITAILEFSRRLIFGM